MSDEKLIVAQICEVLQEPNRALVARLLSALGQDKMLDLTRQVIAIEDAGGQLVRDGSRKRTMGGILCQIVKRSVSPDEKRRCFARTKRTISV